MLREFPHSITAYMNNHSGGSSEYHEIGYIFIVAMEQKTEIERIQEELIKIKQKEKRNMEQKPKEYIEEVNKEMVEFIKEEADKYGTPPAGIETIPKRRIIYKEILDKLFETYKAKDRDYGSAFSEMFDELGIDYAYGKLREKINRIKVLRNQPNMVENEGLEDALLDTAGYAILTLVELKKRKQ